MIRERFTPPVVHAKAASARLGDGTRNAPWRFPIGVHEQEPTMADKTPQTKGREANAAQPLGQRPGLVSEKATQRVGEESRRRAGPDGPDATEVGETFKRAP
jgi:hypothetical protein